MQENVSNAVLIQNLTALDLERIVKRVVNESVVTLREQVKPLAVTHQRKELPKVIRRKDVAKMFQVSLTTIDDWTKVGIIKSYKIGNRVYYAEDEIKRALGYKEEE